MPEARPVIDRLCVIGVGLIGGSLALALREAGVCREVVGCDRDSAHLSRAKELGIIDRGETRADVAVEGADVILLAVPLMAMRPVMEQIAPVIENTGAVVTDVGSAKGSVVADARAVLGAAVAGFVPGHPIAGRECSGPEAAFPELFRGRRVLVTPLEENAPEAVNRVEAMWQATGAEVERMSVSHHDHVLAATSHLPHMLAFGLVDCLASMEEKREIFRYAAGGFADFTRIASSDPEMWRDICLANREEILWMVEAFNAEMADIARLIRAGEGEALLETFGRAKAARDQFCRKNGID